MNWKPKSSKELAILLRILLPKEIIVKECGYWGEFLITRYNFKAVLKELLSKTYRITSILKRGSNFSGLINFDGFRAECVRPAVDDAGWTICRNRKSIDADIAIITYYRERLNYVDFYPNQGATNYQRKRRNKLIKNRELDLKRKRQL